MANKLKFTKKFTKNTVWKRKKYRELSRYGKIEFLFPPDGDVLIHVF